MSLIALTLAAPLVAAGLIAAFGRLAAALALGAAALGALASLGLLAGAAQPQTAVLTLPGLPGYPLILQAAPINALLSALVSVVAGFVLIYAVGYMRGDPQKSRFFATMLVFVAAMQALVLAGDWITLLAAWELIGFSSYLLIGFWHERKEVPAAAARAFIYTRSADLGLYIAVFILIGAAGSSRIDAALDVTGMPAVLAAFGLLAAAAGKSAQVPMQDWLQRAMAGPTPVSALLHSATLVAAGAILLIRAAPMLPPSGLVAVGVVGGVTTVIGGLMALAERDLKRLLAASTSSQYGLMLVAVGAGVPIAAVLHLVAHAVIKSTLFLGAGVFQHDQSSTAMDRLKGAGRARPRIFAGFAVAALALAGIPPLAGFFSKDAVIAASLSAPGFWWLAPFALAGTLLTGAYMARALKVLWGSEAPVAKEAGSALWMGAGFGGLAVLAATLGFSFGGIERLLASEIATGVLAPLLGLGFALTGLALGWAFAAEALLGRLHGWASAGFEVAGGMDAMILAPTLRLAHLCNGLDRRLYSAALGAARRTDRLGVLGQRSDSEAIDRSISVLVRRTIAAGGTVRRLQSGLIHRQLALTVLGIALLLALLLTARLIS